MIFKTPFRPPPLATIPPDAAAASALDGNPRRRLAFPAKVQTAGDPKPMTIRTPALIAAAALSLAAAACSPATQESAKADANVAAEKTGAAAEKAGSALHEEASQVGSAVSAGAKEAAQEVDETTDAMARGAERQKAETKADHTGNATPH